jgi:hypothetical protein
MLIDEEVFKTVMEKCGFSYGVSKKHKTPQAEQDWIYLIHHFHPPEKVEDMEIVHHCFMLEKKNLKGKKYEQMHVEDGSVFQHCLRIDEVEKAPKVVYDHLNNEFKIVIREIDKKKYAVISKPSNISNIRWSEQDRS